MVEYCANSELYRWKVLKKYKRAFSKKEIRVFRLIYFLALSFTITGGKYFTAFFFLITGGVYFNSSFFATSFFLITGGVNLTFSIGFEAGLSFLITGGVNFTSLMCLV